MAHIRTSLHGRLAGIDHDDKLVCPAGLLVGSHGSQRALAGPSTAALFDDFYQLDTGIWLATEGTDAATSAAAVLAGGMGGVLRLTTGDAGTGYAADAEQITSQALQWQASNGGLVCEYRVKLSAITTCYAFLGLTDTIAGALEQPILSAGSANTITTNATDAVGFMFDTGMTDDNWWLVGVANNVDATHQDTGFAPVADTYETLRIELTAAGVATFFRNGVQVGTSMTGAVTAATDLAPVFTVSKLSVAASMTMDLDYAHIAMNR